VPITTVIAGRHKGTVFKERNKRNRERESKGKERERRVFF
jgi:hypothetical protein